MRISDWSSDVCSSDLLILQQRLRVPQRLPQRMAHVRGDRVEQQHHRLQRLVAHGAALVGHVVELRHVVELLHQRGDRGVRSEEHTSELQSLMRISYAVFCLKKKKKNKKKQMKAQKYQQTN